eukprot:741858-Amphidinium_carterae.2
MVSASLRAYIEQQRLQLCCKSSKPRKWTRGDDGFVRTFGGLNVIFTNIFHARWIQPCREAGISTYNMSKSSSGGGCERRYRANRADSLHGQVVEQGH